MAKRLKKMSVIAIGFWIHSLLIGSESLVIQNGKIYTITNGIIESGHVVIQNGVIIQIGTGVEIPPDAEIVDATGKVVMPGLIDSFTNLGIADLPSFGSDDDEATDPLLPHLRVIDALNPENRYLRIAIASGVTTVLCAPADGNLLTGQSALIHLSAESVSDMVLSFPAAVHGCLGELPKMRYGKKNRMPMTRMGSAALLRQTLIDAGAYNDRYSDYEKKLEAYNNEKGEDREKPSPPVADFMKQALIPVLRGEIPIVLSANRLDDILTAIRIADEFNIRIILNHGAEAYKIGQKLTEKNIPVLVGPSSSNQDRVETLEALPENPALLHEAGVKFAFQTGSIQNVNGLLNEAREAVRNGLPYHEALKALTLYPAEIFGLDSRIGSIQVGKLADIVIFNRDPLTLLSSVEMVFINGNKVFCN